MTLYPGSLVKPELECLPPVHRGPRRLRLLLHLLLLMYLLARLGPLVHHLLRLLLLLPLRRRDGLIGVNERIIVEVEHDPSVRSLCI